MRKVKEINRKLVEQYFAVKIAKRNPEFATVRNSMGTKAYVRYVLGQPLELFPKDLVCECEKKVLAKFEIREHKNLFSRPNVGQFISDLLGNYSLEDIIDFFQYETGVSRKTLAVARIGGQVITRPTLIWYVGRLEEATGRTLLQPDVDEPLAYLPDHITLMQIAKYFTATEELLSRLYRIYGK